MSDIWVISDTHFGHENIIKYCDRPFHDVYQMDEYMVTMWNETVKPGDKVYHLGDVYFGGKRPKTDDYWNWFFGRLHGQKRLVLGNHDDGKDKNLHAHFRKIDVWRMFPSHGLLLTHVPVHPSTILGDLDRDQPRRLKNIHGHTHTNGEPRNGKVQDKENYKCVCVELIDYRPVNIETLRIT